jgi:Flp pilus assembly protein TadD
LPNAAVDAWSRAVTLEAALQYDEPPAWFYTVRQSLGGALLRGGDYEGAERVFREALATRPRDGRLLYGLWQALLAQERGSEAALVQQQFARAWRGATTQLTLDAL